MTSTAAFRRVSVAPVSQPTVVPADLSVEMRRSEATSDAPGYAFEERIYVADWDALAEWSFALEIAEA